MTLNRRGGGAGKLAELVADLNGVGRINWKLRIESGKSVDLGYKWHYFWR
jgi:hypothetical protein